MITHLLLAYKDGTRLFSRCWDLHPEADWERTVIASTKPLWPEVFQKDDYHVAYVGDRLVVYTLVDQVLLFALGTDISELGLQEYLKVVIAVLKEFEKKGSLAPKVIQENYAAVVTALEEVVAHGRLAWTVMD
eukprot:EG_transcript_29102